MGNLILSVDRVSKSYQGRAAVSDLSFDVGTGGVVGFLGPNGAGKSTTLRMIVGVMAPNTGAISLFGEAPSPRVLRRVGYLPEERGLYKKMKAATAIAFFARLKGVEPGRARKRAFELLEAHGLGAWAEKPIKALSKGMAQKVQILAAIAHDPDFVILDEPFSGLDPVNQQSFEALIQDLKSQGKTILFSTHVMQHAQRLCDRIVLIAQGKKVFDGPVADALAYAPRHATIDVDAVFDLGAALKPLGFSAAREGLELDGAQRWRVPLAGPEAVRNLLAACAQSGAPLRLFEPHSPSLHDAFVALLAPKPNSISP